MKIVANENVVNKLNSILNSSELIFEKFSTKSKRFALYTDLGLLAQPQEIKYVKNSKISLKITNH